MKTNTLMRAIAALAITALAAPLPLAAQTWQTVLDYQFVPGFTSGGSYSPAADALGNVFVGGLGYLSASAFSSGLVLKTDTTAANWYLSDNSGPSAPTYGSSVNGLALDSNGNVYSAGTFYSPCSQTSCPGSAWYVRKSSDAGVSWTTVDLFQYVSGKPSSSACVAGDFSGNVFVGGGPQDANGVTHWLLRKSADGGQTWTSVDDISGAKVWGVGFVPGVGLFAVGNNTLTTSTKGKSTTTIAWLVRRSVDGGATWATVDSFQPPISYSAYAWGVSSDSQGNVYVAGRTTILVGSGRTSTAVAQWITRRSSDGGNSWTTVDAFSNVAGKSSWAFGIGRDAAGSVVAVGEGQDAQGSNHWLVRRPNAMGNWQTVDDFQLAPGQTAHALGVIADAAGNLLVNGGANDAAGVGHWIVRRLANSNP